jgi:hypothetical protein
MYVESEIEGQEVLKMAGMAVSLDLLFRLAREERGPGRTHASHSSGSFGLILEKGGGV